MIPPNFNPYFIPWNRPIPPCEQIFFLSHASNKLSTNLGNSPILPKGTCCSVILSFKNVLYSTLTKSDTKSLESSRIDFLFSTCIPKFLSNPPCFLFFRQLSPNFSLITNAWYRGMLKFCLSVAFVTIFLLRSTGILFNSEANCVSVELLDIPATVVLNFCTRCVLFLFVGVLTVCVSFLGLTTLWSVMGCPFVLHNIVCSFGFSLNFRLMKCVLSCSSALDSSVSLERLSASLKVVSFLIIGDVDLSSVSVFLDLIGADSATGISWGWCETLVSVLELLHAKLFVWSRNVMLVSVSWICGVTLPLMSELEVWAPSSCVISIWFVGVWHEPSGFKTFFFCSICVISNICCPHFHCSSILQCFFLLEKSSREALSVCAYLTGSNVYIWIWTPLGFVIIK